SSFFLFCGVFVVFWLSLCLHRFVCRFVFQGEGAQRVIKRVERRQWQMCIRDDAHHITQLKKKA
ncbi:hypothetical protein, partial [Klebsiella pneumoniae]|uniref:hypothetical protein n=1 Tax=Klebsiella pneumoniae TaxID=573 RepID=UPI001F4ABF1D